MSVKCFEILKELIEDGSERFAPSLVCNKKKVDNMRKICNVLDKFAASHETTYFDITIDETTANIKISADCDEIILEDENDKMYAVIGCAKKFYVEQGDDADTIIFTLVFPGVWDNAEG